MNAKTKKQIIFGGSISGAVLLGVCGGIGIGFGIWGSIKESNGGIHNITFFSNQNYYLDKGFNEAAYEGTSNYGRKTGQEVGIKVSETGYSESGLEYIDQYRNMYRNGANIIISAGYNVAGIIGYIDDDGKLIPSENSLSEEFDSGDLSNKSFILIDDNNLIAQSANEQSISVIFNSEESGYLAGIAAGIYSTSMEKQEIEGDNWVGAWGGIYSPTIAFLSGFETGIVRINQIITSVNNDLEVDVELVGLTPDGENKVIPTQVGGTPNDLDWYTDGFDIAQGTTSGNDAIARSKNMVANGVKVIFPVAGGQTLLALDETTSTETKIIGVDTSLEKAVPDKTDNILGSATKDMEIATEYALWYENEFLPAAINYGVEDVNNLTYDEVKNIAETEIPDSTFDKNYGAYQFATKSNPDAIDENANGWNITDSVTVPENIEQSDNVGSVYKGTYANGGVSFTGDEDQLDIYVKDFFLKLGFSVEEIELMEMNWEKFSDAAMQNAGEIPTESITFAENK